MKSKMEIDLALAVISAISPEGYCWTTTDLAEVCGCSKQCIHEIERRALRKLRHPSRLRILVGDVVMPR